MNQCESSYIYVYIYTYYIIYVMSTYTHTYICVCLYTCICVCVYTNETTYLRHLAYIWGLVNVSFHTSLLLYTSWIDLNIYLVEFDLKKIISEDRKPLLMQQIYPTKKSSSQNWTCIRIIWRDNWKKKNAGSNSQNF